MIFLELLYVLYPFVISSALLDLGYPGVCQNYKAGGGSKGVCCSGFFELKGKCIKCANGTTSEEGGNCTQCPENKYGSECIYTCECELNEKCDHVSGCVQKNGNDILGTTDVHNSKDEKEVGKSKLTEWVMYLTIAVALFSLLIVMVLAIAKGIRIYIEKKTSAIKTISKKNKSESNQRKTNIYGTYKKATFQSGDTDDEYGFDSDNNLDEEDQYAYIRESQLVSTIQPHDNQYNTSNMYNTDSYAYNHLTRPEMVHKAMVRENYAQNFGRTMATFQNE